MYPRSQLCPVPWADPFLSPGPKQKPAPGPVQLSNPYRRPESRRHSHSRARRCFGSESRRRFRPRPRRRLRPVRRVDRVRSPDSRLRVGRALASGAGWCSAQLLRWGWSERSRAVLRPGGALAPCARFREICHSSPHPPVAGCCAVNSVCARQGSSSIRRMGDLRKMRSRGFASCSRPAGDVSFVFAERVRGRGAGTPGFRAGVDGS